MNIVLNGNIEKILSETGVYPSVTVGVSMRPLFKTHRDMVILEKPSEKLKKYDVVLYKTSGKYILHRIIDIDELNSVYIIRGDNTYKKEYVPFDAVLARLVSFKRRGKSCNVENKGYLIYSRVWNYIYPIRLVCHLLLIPPKKAYRMFFKKKPTI